MGGMRALEWEVGHPQRVAAALILATGARATADQIGTQTTQIAAIMSDPNWQGGDYYGTGRAPTAGLGIARRIAHLTYRTDFELDHRFENHPQGDEDPLNGGRYAVQSYLEHQADKLIARFDPATYVLLTEAMNRHDVGRGRGGIAAALQATPVPTIVGGIDSDRLYPLRTQQEIADLLPGCAGLEVMMSKDGHDAFLTEASRRGEVARRDDGVGAGEPLTAQPVPSGSIEAASQTIANPTVNNALTSNSLLRTASNPTSLVGRISRNEPANRAAVPRTMAPLRQRSDATSNPRSRRPRPPPPSAAGGARRRAVSNAFAGRSSA